MGKGHLALFMKIMEEWDFKDKDAAALIGGSINTNPPMDRT